MLTQDPLGLAGGVNLYEYAGSNPVSFDDPFGLCTDPSDPRCKAISARGEGRNDVVIVYSDGRTAHEQLRAGGTRAWRNNNPGNLRPGRFSASQGAVGAAGGFAVFGNAEVGGSAQEALLRGSSYSGLSLDDAIARYAPSSENNTERYQQVVRKATGLSGDVRMGDLTPAQLQAVTSAMRAHEGWRAGSTSWREAMP